MRRTFILFLTAVILLAQNPVGSLPQIVGTALGPQGKWLYLQSDTYGNLDISSSQAATSQGGPSGYVPPYALVGKAPDGTWRYLQTDMYGNLSSVQAGVVSIKAYGAVCDGAHMAADTAALSAAIAANGTRAILIPAGTCQINNSAAPVTYTGFTGTLYGEGAGSVLQFSTITNNGIIFTGSTSLTIRDLAFTYAGTVSSRGALQGILNINSSSNVAVSNIYLYNAPDSGIELAQDQHTKLDGVWCTTLYANCIFSVNMVDFSVRSVHSVASGDAAVEVSYYSGNTLNACNQISIDDLESYQDVEGVLINGCQKVAVTNSTIDSTSGTSVSVIQDNSTMSGQKMYPDHLALSNIVITNSGSGPVVSGVVNNAASGMIFNIGTNPSAILRVSLSNIRIYNPKNFGVQVVNTGFNEFKIDASNINIDTTGSGTSGSGGWLANGYENNCALCIIAYAGGSSLSLQNGVNANWTAFQSRNPNVGFGGSDDAILNTSTGTVLFNGVTLYDSNVTVVSRINNTVSSGTQIFLNVVTVMPNGAWNGFTNNNAAAYFTSTGANIVYRCTSGGTLATGALTITAADCGSATDTGQRVN